jgi:hypothetical protein
VLDELHQAAGLVRGLGELGTLVRGRLQVQAGAGAQQVADHQTDGQRDGRHRQEVDERQATDLPDGGRRLHLADAEHDGAEDDRHDHHLDQADEHGAEHADALANVGSQDADRDAGEHGDDDGDVQPVGAIPLLGWRVRW